MSTGFAQSVVIETGTGAGGAISATLHAKFPYAARKDFAGITCVGYSTTGLVVPPALGVTPINSWIALAKA